ncbi:MAG: hypothetical protein EBX17_09840, partial [Betaproteobacteria bacterium]|nr:hypothetical protein [Betaproteobacteria bacterium]
MRIDKLTTQLQQALAEAQSLCIAQDHPYIEAAHVVLALLQQPEGSGRALLERAGARLPALKTGLEGLLARIAKVQGGDGQVQVSRELSQLLNLAEKEAGKRGDHYVASEMLLLALMDKEGVGECGKALREAGLSRTSLETAIQALRGGHSVQSPEAEGQREALKKYTVDLTERASLGKLDPVIGRDDEIRRAIQILQRRTKNNPVLIGEPGVGKTAIVEPTVEATIAILRGLQERYEVHHGVEITDPAIVAAAELSNRYISDRFLPDKAIDLIDEAAARIKIEIDSKPESMDKLDRRIIQLKIEREAVRKESDESSRKRLDLIEQEISKLEREYA